MKFYFVHLLANCDEVDKHNVLKCITSFKFYSLPFVYTTVAAAVGRAEPFQMSRSHYLCLYNKKRAEFLSNQALRTCLRSHCFDIIIQ